MIVERAASVAVLTDKTKFGVDMLTSNGLLAAIEESTFRSFATSEALNVQPRVQPR
jgi:hypothetical protein